ncbi:hypothetical protein GIB67_009015 [Kingdonia uniflora]|uniref:Apple domain-containing protein n=1 Tax=Kingdonia uniflora TaxID=39325 RepID=A0A7J7LVX5_9MAGN|nr:hypothetical protein GIB67_009015 [Kingdonia uniflora]
MNKTYCFIVCSCTAYSYGNECLAWQQDLQNLQKHSHGDSIARDLHIRLAPSKVKRDCIKHCNTKPENIILDVELNPEAANFSLAKIFSRDLKSCYNDYERNQKISRTRMALRKNLNMTEDDMADYFPALAANMTNKGEEFLSLLDYKLEGNANSEELTRNCKVACLLVRSR